MAKKYSIEYMFEGRKLCMDLKADSFEHAEALIKTAFDKGQVAYFRDYDKYAVVFYYEGLKRYIDIEDADTPEEARRRLHCAYYNGEIGQVILSIPVSF